MRDRFDTALKTLMPFEKIKTFLSSVIESSNDGFWVCDGAGKILYNNRASEKLTGINTKNFLGRNVADLVKQGMWKESVTLGAILEKKKHTKIQHVVMTGKKLLSTATPVFNDNGDIELVVTIERDITLFTNMQNHLKQINQK